jgi:hypothetical protein
MTTPAEGSISLHIADVEEKVKTNGASNSSRLSALARRAIVPCIWAEVRWMIGRIVLISSKSEVIAILPTEEKSVGDQPAIAILAAGALP